MKRYYFFQRETCSDESDEHIRKAVKFFADWIVILALFVLVLFACVVAVAFSDGE